MMPVWVFDFLSGLGFTCSRKDLPFKEPYIETIIRNFER